MKTVYRYIVPVDDRPHEHRLTGDPQHVALGGSGLAVEFWAEWHPAQPGRARSFRVFGTGHDIPDDARYVGTASRSPLGFVWHLYEVASDV